MQTHFRYTALTALLMTAGCGLLEPDTECVDVVIPALKVTVVDSASGAPVLDATVVASEGAYGDTLSMYQNVASGPSGRPGAYRVEATAERYQPWVRDDVRVMDTGCPGQVHMVELTARLQPEP